MCKYIEVDIGNQIDNSWNKDTAIALKLNKVSFSLKIREKDKKKLEKKYIKKVEKRSDKRKNRKVVVMIYSFLLYKLLIGFNGLAKRVRLCRDINPSKHVYRCLRIISKYYGDEPIDEKIRIRFKKEGHGNSSAHRVANRVYKGRKSPNLLIKKKDMEDLQELIEIAIK